MLRAKDIMSTCVITVTPETEIAEAAKLLLDHGINGLPVVQKNKLVGILCQSDLITQQKRLSIPSVFTLLDSLIPLASMKHMEREVRKISATTVAQAMTSEPVTVNPETCLDEIATLMVDKNFHTLPVVDGETLVGVIGKADVLKTLTSAAPSP